MKFTSKTTYENVPRTIDGITHMVRQARTEHVPKAPTDWDAAAVRAAAGIVLSLTLAAVLWSTVSIGDLLGGGVGYAAAAIFDLAWLVVLLVEWLARFDAEKRVFPKRMGWLLALVAAAAIAAHGLTVNGLTGGGIALAAVGAAVSIVSKALWVVVMRFVIRDISGEDTEWMAAEISATNAREAISTVRLRGAAAEERAALRLLQAERIRHQIDTLRAPEQVLTADHESAHEQLSEISDAIVEKVLAALERVREQTAQGEQLMPARSEQATAHDPAHEVFTQASAGEQPLERISSKEQEVRHLADRLRTGEQLTGTRAAELLGVSRPTAQRRLTEARALIADEPSPGYL